MHGKFCNTNNEACIAFMGNNLILANTEIVIHSLFYSEVFVLS